MLLKNTPALHLHWYWCQMQAKFFLWESCCSTLVTIVGMSSDFQISVVKGFLEFHLPPLEMILDWYSFLCSLPRISPPLWRWMCLWRLVCRGLTESIKLPVVGILYLSSWHFAFVLLVFCILSSSSSWGQRTELCPVYLICKVDAQVMASDGKRWHT